MDKGFEHDLCLKSLFIQRKPLFYLIVYMWWGLDVRRVERREVATEATQDVMRSIDFFVDTAGRKKASALWAEA